MLGKMKPRRNAIRKQIVTLPFLPKLLVQYVPLQYLIETNKECNQLYYKCFAQCVTWSHCDDSLPIPQKVIPLITSVLLKKLSPCFDNCPLRRLVSMCETFCVEPYCKSLTFLELKGRVKDYSALTHCTQLVECVLQVSYSYKPFVLPQSILRLTVKDNYYRALTAFPAFPAQLTHLHWDCNQSVPIDQLPSSLTSLETKILHWNAILPPQLSSFVCQHSVSEKTLTNLPPQLTHLHFAYINITGGSCLDFSFFLPMTLLSLSTNDCYPLESIYLPPNLTELFLNTNTKVHAFSTSLKVAHFGNWFNQEIHHLPRGLTELRLGRYFKHEVNHLPLSLTQLIMNCEYYSQNIVHLPDSIQSMTVTSSVLKQIQKWPFGLTRLDVQNVPFDDIHQAFQTIGRPINERVIIVAECRDFLLYVSKQEKHDSSQLRLRCMRCLHQEANCFHK